MYLSRVEITGFKSFADKTVIEFDQGMTAVVGPNGSGKSNLSEAIRWVLGEQSAKSMRGSKMEDVIFNGTQDRKAVNIAKVTLVLNNEDRYLDYDYSEISISRSYNRNGDSQYLINNEQVRLKDIVDLLLDSGLGKNSFSIISQGQVEQIFLNKPEERRTIFEEAAGVQKYQYRKNEAERRMNKSRDNLSRVKDIIHELDLQLKPLMKQREDALSYQSKKEELKALEVSLYTHQIEQYQAGWQEIEAQLLTLNEEISQMVEKQTVLQQTLEEDKSEQAKLIQTIDTQTDHYQQLTATVEQLKAQQQVIERDIQYAKTAQQDKDTAYENQQVEKNRLTKELQRAQDQLTLYQDELSRLKEDLKEVNESIQLSRGLDAQEIEEVRAQLVEQYQVEAKANNSLNQHQQLLDRYQHQVDPLKARIASIKHQLPEKVEAMMQAEKDLESFSQSVQSNKENLSYLQEKSEELSRQRANLQQTLFNQERQTQTLQTRLNTLKHLSESYEGFFGGVKVVMNHAKEIGGIEGTVADAIQVDATYQLAMDTALGNALQNIVVTDDQAARRAVGFLKERRAGRATFLPRTNIKARHIPSVKLFQVEGMSGYVGVASELVRFDEINRAIIENLLGTTLVVDGLANAQDIARKLGHSVRIVTLEGDVLAPGGAVTGGRNQRQQQSVLSRQNEMKDLENQLTAANQALTKLEADWQNVNQALANLDQQVNMSRKQSSQSDAQYQSLYTTHQQAKATYKELETQLLIQEDQLKEMLREMEESNQQVQLAQAQLEAAQATMQQLNTVLKEQSMNEELRLEKLKQFEAHRNQLMTDKAVLDVQMKQTQAQIQDITQQLVAVTQWIDSYEQSRGMGAQSLEELEASQLSVTKQLADKMAESQAVNQLLQDNRALRQQLAERISQSEARLSQYQASLQADYQRQAKLQAQSEKNQAFIDNHLTHLNQEYHLSYEMAKTLAQPIQSAQEVQGLVKKIRQEIDSLGPINLQSIEDYEELNERYQLLVEQETDLLTAMANLQATMDEMDQEVTRRFSETFRLINLNFQRTFKRLFGGGEASLELTNPQDILTTGVDIIAQPPGKRKQNLGLLSGGERALTAIALLFALLELKPVPFVILDEVEAALDDANVFRYGEYIKAFRRQTQFIVITHRKGTMESADRLYGVTMERSGVSKLASVKLSEANEVLES